VDPDPIGPKKYGSGGSGSIFGSGSATLVEMIVSHVQVTCQTACSIYVEIKQSIANDNKNQTTVVSYDYKVIFGNMQL
jgi:hypothetical protein